MHLRKSMRINDAVDQIKELLKNAEELPADLITAIQNWLTELLTIRENERRNIEGKLRSIRPARFHFLDPHPLGGYHLVIATARMIKIQNSRLELEQLLACLATQTPPRATLFRILFYLQLYLFYLI